MTDVQTTEPAMSSEEAQAAAAAAAEEETTAFLDELEKQAKEHMRSWMAARVPGHMREKFDERFPPEEPEAQDPQA